jgi:hypothetical protein
VTGTAAAASGTGPEDPRVRVAATLKRLERTDVGILVVARPDAGRERAVQVARDAAMAAGRGPLLDEATKAARELVMASFARRGFSGTWAVADWSISTARAGDRVAVVAAFEEAVTAAVAEDLVDEETAGILRATSEELAMMTGAPEPGSLSQLARSPIAAVFLVTYIVGLSAIGVVLGSPIGVAVLVVGLGAAAIALSLRRSRGAN